MKTTKRFALGLAVLFALATGAEHAQAQPRVRRNIVSLDGDEQQVFIDAMFALQDPTKFPAPCPVCGWPAAGSPDPRNRYEQYVKAHDTNPNVMHDDGTGANNRGATWFLPWHRQLLFQMENDVRSLGGRFADFTLPYWDGRDAFPRTLNPPAAGGPQPADSLLGGSGSPVTTGPFRSGGSWTSYNPNGPNPGVRTALRRNLETTLNPDGSFQSLSPAGENSMNTLLTKNNYSDLLCGSGTTGIEGADGLHNSQHGAVGGNLGANTTAVPDPAFWLLHSFADLNWARWEAIKGTKYTGVDGSYGVNDPMSGGLTELNTANIYRPDGTVRPADVLNYWTMPGGGYTYEYRPGAGPNAAYVVLGAPVPEPATLGLLMLGMVGLLPKRKHR